MRSKAFNNMSMLLYCIYWFYAKGKNLLDYSNLISPNKYKNNDNTELFSITKRVRMKKYFLLSVKDLENLKIFKYHVFSIRH